MLWCVRFSRDAMKPEKTATPAHVTQSRRRGGSMLRQRGLATMLNQLSLGGVAPLVLDRRVITVGVACSGKSGLVVVSETPPPVKESLPACLCVGAKTLASRLTRGSGAPPPAPPNTNDSALGVAQPRFRTTSGAVVRVFPLGRATPSAVAQDPAASFTPRPAAAGCRCVFTGSASNKRRSRHFPSQTSIKTRRIRILKSARPYEIN